MVAGGRLAAAVIALISIRAVTTVLTPEQYGELSILITIQMFCGLFLVNPVGQHINLHTHAWWDDGTLMARLKSYRHYILAVSLVGGAVVLSVGRHHSLEQLLWTAVAMFSTVAAGTWNSTLIPMLNMLGFRAASVLWTIVTVVIGLATSVLLVMWLPSAASWFAGQAIGMVIGALGASHILLRNAVRSRHSLTTMPLLNKRTFFIYCVPLAFATGFMWLQLSGYRFLIENYWGLTQLGFLVIGLQLAAQIWGLAESLAMQFLYPLFYRRVSSHNNRTEVESAFSDLLNTLVPVYFVITGFLVLSAPYILKVLVAPQFQNAVNFVMLGAAIELFRVLGNLLSSAAHVRRQTKSLALPYALGSLSLLIFIYISGTRQLEIGWAGVGLLIGAIIMFIAMLISMYRQVNFRIDVKRFFVAATTMITMILLAIVIPKVSGLTASIGMLALEGAAAGIAILTILWKNPAALRLINVKLTKN